MQLDVFDHSFVCQGAAAYYYAIGEKEKVPYSKRFSLEKILELINTETFLSIEYLRKLGVDYYHIRQGNDLNYSWAFKIVREHRSSQFRFCKANKVDPKTIRKIEKGDCKRTELSTLVKLNVLLCGHHTPNRLKARALAIIYNEAAQNP